MDNKNCKINNPKSFECLTFVQFIKNESIGDSYGPILITPDFTVLLFDAFLNRDLALIPRYVKRLQYGHNYKFSIKMLPHSLEHLTVGNYYNFLLDLSKNIIFLNIGNLYNKPLKLTKKLLHLYLGDKFSKSIKVSKHLMTLHFSFRYNEHVELSKHVVHLKINYIVAGSIIFTPYISNIEIGLANEDYTHKKIIFEYPHKEVRLVRMHFWGWDGHFLSNNVEKNILICEYHINQMDNMPTNIVVHTD